MGEFDPQPQNDHALDSPLYVGGVNAKKLFAVSAVKYILCRNK